QQRTPLETEIVAIDRCGGRERGARAARCLPRAPAVFGLEHHAARHIADGELAVNPVSAAGFFDARALVAELREFLDVEKISRAHLAVAIVVSGVDAGGVDRHLHRGTQKIPLVELYRPGKGAEAAAHSREQEVTDGKADGRASGVDVPRRHDLN